jgi:hypothetical protein
MNNEIEMNQQDEQDNLDLDLFAEELPDQTDLAVPSFCTAATIGTTSSFSTAGSCGGTAATGSSISSAC